VIFPRNPEDGRSSRSSSGVVLEVVAKTDRLALGPDARMHTGSLMDDLFAAVKRAEESAASRRADPAAPGATQRNQEEGKEGNNDKIRVRTVPAAASSEPG